MRYQCSSCDTIMKEAVPFCIKCGHPTAHATTEQQTEWELRQWRRHSSVPGETRTQPASVSQAERVQEPQAAPQAAAHLSTPRPSLRIQRRAKGTSVSSHAPRVGSEGRPRVDDPFHYTACTSCGKTDWLLRTGRNEDESWRYWCVRCSRALKTDARLPHGMKPFIAGGSILVVLAVLANVL